MGQVLHGSARTTAALRRAIQDSQASLKELAGRYGINAKTVAKWRKRSSVEDAVMGPKQPHSTVLTEEQEMLLEYRKTILNALKDVSNSLVAYKETRERRKEQMALVVSATDAVRLAKLRYSGGNTSYLEVLTTDTDLYDGQLQLAQN